MHLYPTARLFTGLGLAKTPIQSALVHATGDITAAPRESDPHMGWELRREDEDIGVHYPGPLVKKRNQILVSRLLDMVAGGFDWRLVVRR